MAEPNSDSTRKRVHQIGIATFTTLCSQIALSFVGYFALSAQHPSRMHAFGAEVIVWMACAFVLGVMLCGLAVVYLRAVFRGKAAPTKKVLWTVLIISFGPFAMAYYWTVHMRPLSHGMAY
jgi:hypothetical protein